MQPKPYRIDEFFDRENCDLCGVCFSECPEMGLSREAAREEIEMAVKGRPRYVLGRCTTCRVCNSLCPNDCNPFGLVGALRNHIYESRGVGKTLGIVSPHFPPNLFSSVKGKLSGRERDVLRAWSSLPEKTNEIFFAGTIPLLFPYLWDSTLLEGLPIFAGEGADAGVFYFVPGYLGPAQETFTSTAKILNSIGVERIVAETEPYDMLKNNPFKKRMNFEVVHIVEWLLEKIQTGSINATVPISKTLTVHDNCMARDFPHMMAASRELISNLGCSIVEMDRSKERGICCGLGGGSRSLNVIDMISQAVVRLKEAEQTGAEGLAVYCTGCLWMFQMARVLSGSRLPVYHVFELVRMASGESSLQAEHARRAWDIIGSMGDGILSNLGHERKFFIDEVPANAGPEHAGVSQPFPNRLASTVLSSNSVRNAASALGPNVISTFMKSFQRSKRLFFNARVFLGTHGRNLLSTSPLRFALRAIPAPADLLYWAGTRNNNKAIGVLKRVAVRVLPLHLILRLTGRPTVGLPCSAAINKMLGRTFEQATRDPQLHLDTVDRMLELLKIDMLMGVVDSTIETEASGCEVAFPEVGVPHNVTHPAPTLEELEKLKIPDPKNAGRMTSFIEGTRLMCEKFKILSAVLICGPFTIACELGGAENVASSIITNPRYVRKLMEFSTEVSKAYMRALVDAGVDVILIGDPTAGMLSRRHFWEFLGEYMKDLIGSCPVPVILHICGDTDHIIELMVRMGPDGLSLDKVSLPEVIARIPKDVVIVGNIDPVSIMEQGTVDEVKKNVADLCKEMSCVTAFVCAPGCDVSPETPIENLEAMVAAIQEYGQNAGR